jgi:hypothetical protein
MFNDLHVIMYEGGKGNPFGHLGSAVNSDNTRPPDNRLRTPPVTPWAIPAFIGCINPAVNAPNIPCFSVR